MTDESRSTFWIPKSPPVEAARKLEAIDRSLQLIMTADKARLSDSIDGTVAELLSRLMRERETLAELVQQPRPFKDAARVAPRRQAKASLLRSVFQRTPVCDPIDQETVSLDPVDFGCDFLTFPTQSAAGGWYSQFGATSWSACSLDNCILFNFTMADPNNDPFNFDYNKAYVIPKYVFELPSRPFRARYDVRAEIRLIVQRTAWSNNIFGTVFSGAMVNGYIQGVNADGVIPLCPEEPFRCVLEDDGTVSVDSAGGTNAIHDLVGDFDSGPTVAADSIVLESGRDINRHVVLLFPMSFYIAQGTLEIAGSAGFSDAVNPPPLPRLTCTISPD